ncbi:DUF4010 domain-containing protein [Acinetobacter gerneri]|uniref:DUF4010 domain-containing protein n=1 Tax=Acinetobacter gerneri TaxID=202952 RepID=A0AAW8JGJ0_9GAMM|nr:DUF4010 domain-containing protein [Acinetobacter gerneri]MDQ9009488.1 DUF4010 domain-containing protein [Acinetobacter gerneri]MDQ9013593.1 DUF4010 domain-containing protein [Acinetobacter gerneri]MDQ9024843.1 DUF4010 domain-containing protein [Acinetobacter gerneri]MDQ9052366.1 DUF4010 domain-containing protein [Acinetobacter gerneri]MDQ9059909.1 DUF4010 domain-containing protein [Acinetobacter gerneri]
MSMLSLISIHTISITQFLTIIAAALGCGLLIGLERERSRQRENQHSFAGFRSFAICSLLGAICFLFDPILGIVGAIVVGGICIITIKNQKEDPGITTEIAFFFTYFIGAMCIYNITFATALAVILTILLLSKHKMHQFAGKWITESEITDGIFLLALILIALPLMPNKPLWGQVLNPYVIVKLLSLILAVQALAHIAKRLMSKQKALILSSVASGFVSSTATIANLGMQVRAGHAQAKSNAGAALMSCVATLLQLLIIVAGTNPAWLKVLIVPCLSATLILIIAALFLMYKSQNNESVSADTGRMFSLKEAGIIAITLTLIQAGVYGLSVLLGDAGLLAGTLLASLFEVHGAMASVVMQGDPDQTILFYAVVLGLSVHALAKCVNSFLTGGLKFLLYFAPFQILHMAVLVLLMFIMIRL